MDAAKLCFLDWLGSAVGGSRSEPVQVLLQLAPAFGDGEGSTLIPEMWPAPSLFAALVNAAASHVLEMDDLDRGSIYHPAAAVIPAALALAESQRASGPLFLTAIVLGYEASIRIGEAVNPSHYRYWHTTGTVGTFGAAAACAVLLGLDSSRIVHALGSAGTQAAGLWQFLADGAMSKQLHPAKAAFNGLLSALIAEKGFTAATSILEGDKGFCKATAAEYDLGKITSGLSRAMTGYKICGVSFKKHASCRHTHSAIDAMLELVEQHGLKPEAIKSIEVRIYSQALDLLGGVEANTPYVAKFSLPYCLAVAAIYGNAGPDRFSEECLQDKAVLSLMQQVTMVVDTSLDSLYPQLWPAVVKITTMDGRVLERRVDHPKGDPEKPLSRDELCQKFRELTSPVLPSERRERYVQQALSLEHQASMDSFL